MSQDEEGLWADISLRKAAVLRELADGRTEPEIAGLLGVELSTVRTHVGELKNITGCGSVREIGRWWRANRRGWAEYILALGGVPDDDVGPKRTSG